MLCSKRGPGDKQGGCEVSDRLITEDEGLRLQTVCDVNGGQLMLLGAKQHAQLQVNMLQILGAGSGLQVQCYCGEENGNSRRKHEPQP